VAVAGASSVDVDFADLLLFDTKTASGQARGSLDRVPWWSGRALGPRSSHAASTLSLFSSPSLSWIAAGAHQRHRVQRRHGGARRLGADAHRGHAGARIHRRQRTGERGLHRLRDGARGSVQALRVGAGG
jgi:hypothetical protein